MLVPYSDNVPQSGEGGTRTASSCRAPRRTGHQGPFGGRSATVARLQRSVQPAVHQGGENAPLLLGSNSRRSPRLGAGPSSAGAAGALRGNVAFGGGSGGRGLQDVTNVYGSRASREKKQLDHVRAGANPPTPAIVEPAPRAASAPRRGQGLARLGGLGSCGAGTATEAARPSSRQGGPQAEPEAERKPGAPGAAAAGQDASAADVRLQWVGDYSQEILAVLFSGEEASLPRAGYMELQTEINGRMRAILIDWLVEVHMKYRLRPETLYLTVNVIDRYLSRTQGVRKRLQLVGVVAMFIAAKFEEITPPEVVDFAYICDNAYSKEDILQMECTMLFGLGFHICVPTAVHFLNHAERANESDPRHAQLGRYLLELALLEVHMLRFAPSLLVAAAVLLSNELVGRAPVWPPCMAHHCRYGEEQLRACVGELRTLLAAAPGSSLQAVRKRYTLEQHLGVALEFRGSVP